MTIQTIQTIQIQCSTNYPIHIGMNILTSLWLEFCKKITQKIVIITDSNLEPTIGYMLKQLLKTHGVVCELICIPAGGQYKSRETKEKLENTLLEKKYGRDTYLIALGGGTVTDLVGFLASTYCRGIPVMYLPTTLLAMVDASIGGKTGVDTPFGKNLIGSFYQPSAVFMDLSLLQSLPSRELKNGVVEILKHGLIWDKKLFNVMQENTHRLHDPLFLMNIVHASCVIKKIIIEQDEHDLGIRQLLNFGHTIGHAIETIEEGAISHGEAVAIGMIVEAHLAFLLHRLERNCVNMIINTLQQYRLPLQTNAFKDPEQFKHLMGLDKKAFKNQPQFILLDSIGHAFSHNNQWTFPVKNECIDHTLEWAHAHFKPRNQSNDVSKPS